MDKGLYCFISLSLKSSRYFVLQEMLFLLIIFLWLTHHTCQDPRRHIPEYIHFLHLPLEAELVSSLHSTNACMHVLLCILFIFIYYDYDYDYFLILNDNNNIWIKVWMCALVMRYSLSYSLIYTKKQNKKQNRNNKRNSKTPTCTAAFLIDFMPGTVFQHHKQEINP